MDVFIDLRTPYETVEELINKIRLNGYKAYVDWNVYVIRTDAPRELIEQFRKLGWGIQSYSEVGGGK